jgi:hypothetical protein
VGGAGSTACRGRRQRHKQARGRGTGGESPWASPCSELAGEASERGRRLLVDGAFGEVFGVYHILHKRLLTWAGHGVFIVIWAGPATRSAGPARPGCASPELPALGPWWCHES